ncbi:MAG: hypothetical protein HYZ25_08270 [Chloroflexi bacterium]|nr:hypothetical protein [Chloroflexota bacterium]
MKFKIISAMLVLALASLACSFTINLPETATPGPDVTDKINVPAPSSGKVSLEINFGAGDLTLAPGADDLVSGTATYNFPDLKPKIEQDGSNVKVSQGPFEFKGVPTLNNVKNTWDLKLGSTPMDLTIAAGAYDGTMDLGGLSLTNLTVKDGASTVKLNFSAPNQAEMTVFRYETGASDVTIKGLANANFGTMVFSGGAGNYDLGFDGKLKRDATITIDCGLSDLTLRVPEGVHAVVTVEGGLSGVNTSSNWTHSGDSYTQPGDGPTLTFIVKLGAGNLTLTD